MSVQAERFHLAALVHSVGRRQAAEYLARDASPRTALARVAHRRADPGTIERACGRYGVRVLVGADRDYPPLLHTIADPPPVLYVRGDPRVLLHPVVAIVGARRCSRAGAEVAARLSGDLAARGVCVVSGLARGIDTAAHRAAIRQGRTVAVVGSGLGNPYPTENRGLVDAILDGGGLLLSEYPPEAGPRRHHFPERNRLISGLARGVVVVEAGEESGSLITARLALEQGRDVAAVPGSVLNPRSRGGHRLLRQGAALVETAADVLEAFGLAQSPALSGPVAVPGAAPAGPGEGLAAILAAVEDTLTTTDQIVATTGVSARAAAAALVELELGGFVRQVAGGYIRRPLP